MMTAFHRSADPTQCAVVSVLPGAGDSPRARINNGASNFRRRDIEGLRGVAIVMVAIFHVWFGRVSGGVDIFLALSGFFFGGRLMRIALNPNAPLNPVREITRLVRRLLPALIVVLVACAALTMLIQPNTRWEAFADQSLASLGYYQNWELARTASNYLRAGEAVSPLQHFWSLSVQGQFYIGYLTLIVGFAYLLRRACFRRMRLILILLLSALTTASFVYALSVHQSDQPSAYYDSFARAWELLLGVLAGAVVPYIRWSKGSRTAVSVTALAIILLCGAFINGAEQFPGPWALVPVGAAILFILSAANSSCPSEAGPHMPAANRLLASRPLVALGSIAYSLYLWHWPLLIFWLAYSGHASADFVEGAGVLLVAGILAWVTTRYVEEPLRMRGAGSNARSASAVRTVSPLRRPAFMLGSLMTLLSVALTVTSFSWREHMVLVRAKGEALTELTARDYPGARALTDLATVPTQRMRPTVLEAGADLPVSTNDGCISDFQDPSIRKCVYGDKLAPRVIALAGGSHAEHWITALDLLGRTHNFKIVTYLKMGCPLSAERLPLIPGSNAAYPQCFDWVQKTLTQLVTDRPDYVFTTVTRPRNTAPGDVMPDAYLPVWATLADSGIRVLGMRDTPWLVRDGQPAPPPDCLAAGGDAVSCGVPRSDVLSDANPAAILPQRFPTMTMLDMSDAVCRRDYCRAVEGNILIYHDSHHLSATYVRSMAPELGRQMAAATQWW